MAQSLWDHHRRLGALELAFEALRGLMLADPNNQLALRNAVQKLNAGGAKGAAQLLIGDCVSAPYRR
jgi:hypothetical protein